MTRKPIVESNSWVGDFVNMLGLAPLHREPKRDPNVDRALGELWLISDIITADIRTDFAAARRKAAEWEPAPIPDREEFP